EIRTPIYDVYSALFTNHVINTERFGAAGASALEQEILGRYQAEKALVLAAIEADLSDGTGPHAEQSEELHAYETFVAGELGIVDEEKAEGELQEQWAEGTLTLKEYLKTAAENGWVTDGILDSGSGYLTGDEAYEILKSYIME